MVSQTPTPALAWHRILQHLVRASQETVGLGLSQREAGSTQHSLRSCQGVGLTSASLLPYIEVLQKPITLRMQRRDVGCGCHQVFAFGNLVCLVRLQLGL